VQLDKSRGPVKWRDKLQVESSVGYRETKFIKHERNSLFVVCVEFEVRTAMDMKSSEL
jgi:hypothetical protein